jgi:hypothetical protein
MAARFDASACRGWTRRVNPWLIFESGTLALAFDSSEGRRSGVSFGARGLPAPIAAGKIALYIPIAIGAKNRAEIGAILDGIPKIVPAAVNAERGDMPSSVEISGSEIQAGG